MHYKIKKGLDIPINGKPTQTISPGAPVNTVAVLGNDYIGLKPTMLVQEGDRVIKGQPLFTDKKNPGINFTAPASGNVKAINRGAKRALLSVVIEIDAVADANESVDFGTPSDSDVASLKQRLTDSGLWTSFRTRPYSKVPAFDSEPSAIFVTAMDSNPLAQDPKPVIDYNEAYYVAGLEAVSQLTSGKVYVCSAADNLPKASATNIESHTFEGPHPAGLVGTHMHMIEPVHAEKVVWHIGYQDVIAIGALQQTGKLYTDRIVALSGAQIEQPRLVETRLGASINDLVDGSLVQGRQVRLISGSVLNGQRAAGAAAYLRRYDNQITAILEDHSREWFGWIAPGLTKYSRFNVLLSAFNRKKTYDFGTLQNGSPRAMVPLGQYEAVVPLDVLPTQLLRAIVVGDTDMAQKLGCLELDEEDLALCSFVCQSKSEFGPVLRDVLTRIERDG